MITNHGLRVIERARAAHELQAQASRLDEIRAAGKPSADQHVVTYERAVELTELFDYEDGETIGLLAIGGYSDSMQRVYMHHGEVFVDPEHELILRPRYNAQMIPVNGTGWTAQR